MVTHSSRPSATLWRLATGTLARCEIKHRNPRSLDYLPDVLSEVVKARWPRGERRVEILFVLHVVARGFPAEPAHFKEQFTQMELALGLENCKGAIRDAHIGRL